MNLINLYFLSNRLDPNLGYRRNHVRTKLIQKQLINYDELAIKLKQLHTYYIIFYKEKIISLITFLSCALHEMMKVKHSHSTQLFISLSNEKFLKIR